MWSGCARRIDADVIVGHNFVGFTLDVLLHRMKECKVAEWSKLGRLRRTRMPKLSAFSIFGTTPRAHSQRATRHRKQRVDVSSENADASSGPCR